MAKSYKHLGETHGKNRFCLRCFNCKIRTFRTLKDLKEWCRKRELPLHATWKTHFKKDGEIKLYWCTKSNKKPRRFRVSDAPFRNNCEHFDG